MYFVCYDLNLPDLLYYCYTVIAAFVFNPMKNKLMHKCIKVDQVIKECQVIYAQRHACGRNIVNKYLESILRGYHELTRTDFLQENSKIN